MEVWYEPHLESWAHHAHTHTSFFYTPDCILSHQPGEELQSGDAHTLQSFETSITYRPVKQEPLGERSPHSLYLYRYASDDFIRVHEELKVCSSSLDDVGVEIRRRNELLVRFLFRSLQNRRKRKEGGLIKQLADSGSARVRHAGLVGRHSAGARSLNTRMGRCQNVNILKNTYGLTGFSALMASGSGSLILHIKTSRGRKKREKKEERDFRSGGSTGCKYFQISVIFKYD